MQVNVKCHRLQNGKITSDDVAVEIPEDGNINVEIFKFQILNHLPWMLPENTFLLREGLIMEDERVMSEYNVQKEDYLHAWLNFGSIAKRRREEAKEAEKLAKEERKAAEAARKRQEMQRRARMGWFF